MMEKHLQGGLRAGVRESPLPERLFASWGAVAPSLGMATQKMQGPRTRERSQEIAVTCLYLPREGALWDPHRPQPVLN